MSVSLGLMDMASARPWGPDSSAQDDLLAAGEIITVDQGNSNNFQYTEFTDIQEHRSPSAIAAKDCLLGGALTGGKWRN